MTLAECAPRVTPIPHAAARATAGRWLARAGGLWLAVALAGQLAFAAYVAAVYGGVLLGGGPEAWNRSPAQAYRPGDPVGNLMFGLHALLAVAVIVGGVVQLAPVARRRLPGLHRWVGRAYLLSAAVLAAGGIALVAWRGTVGSPLMQAGTVLNGVAILACAALAWSHARARRLDLHRRWALRLFLAVSGVWFFRVGLMLWLLAFRAPVGFDPATFTGPFLVALSHGQFLVPLAVLELYFRAQDSGTAAQRLAMAVLLAVLVLLTAGGILGAILGMWLPRL